MRPSILLGLLISAALTANAQSLVQTYCVSCHNQTSKTGGVSLDTVDPARIADDTATWEWVLRKLRKGEMPPPGVPRPDSATMARFIASLEDALDRVAAAHPNPGRPAIHRLNRSEYSNAIRDLLALDIQAGSMLPVDDSGYGFDNNADVLSMSPALLDRYLSAACRVSRLAVGDLKMNPVEERFAPVKDPPSQFRRVNRIERVSSDLPFGSRGGLSFKYYFPLDAEYVIRILVPTGAISFGQTITGDSSRYELRLPIKAGLRTVGVTFLREGTKAEVAAAGARQNDTVGRPPELEMDPVPAHMDLRLDAVRLKLFEVPRRPAANPDVNTVIVDGPYNVTGRGEECKKNKRGGKCMKWSERPL